MLYPIRLPEMQLSLYRKFQKFRPTNRYLNTGRRQNHHHFHSNDNLLQQFTKYQAQLDYYQSKGLELADELVNFAGKGYAGGEIEYVEYIRNLDQANSIRNQYLETLRRYKQTQIEINYLMGTL